MTDERAPTPPAEGPAYPVIGHEPGTHEGVVATFDWRGVCKVCELVRREREAAARIDPDALGTAIHTVNYGWQPHNGEAGHDPGDSDCACNAAQIADAYNARLAAVQEDANGR